MPLKSPQLKRGFNYKIMPRGYLNKNGLPIQLGRHHTEETIRKLKESHKGHIGYWLGKKRPPFSEETKRRMSEARMGYPFWGNKHHSEETKKRIGEGNKNKIISEETRKKMSEIMKGKKSYFWKGGISPINKIIRKGLKFRLWREAIFKKDNYTCWICEKRGFELHPHHLKKFSDYPELRFKIRNGLTLCKFCHKTYTNWGK